MKKITLFVAALAAVCSCNKSEVPTVDPQPSGKTITVTSGATVGEQTKVTMSAKSGDAYPMSWDNEESTYLREVIKGLKTYKSEPDSVCHYGSDNFVKNDAHSGKFTFTIAETPGYERYYYVAVYPSIQGNPKGIPTHGVRYGGDDSKNRISYILNHTKNQIPAADGPDQTTHIYVAADTNHTVQATSIDLAFESVVSYGKMNLKNFPALAGDETVSKITITAPSTNVMTGRVYQYFRKSSDGHKVGEVIPYDKNNVKPYVMIDPKNITFNTTGFDVWFTTLPFELAAGDTLSVIVATNKKTYSFSKALAKALDFSAGRVSEFTFDYAKRITDQKIITFPFTTLTAVPEKWPTAASVKWSDYDNCDSGLAIDNGGVATENLHRRMTAKLKIEEETYTFVLADADSAGSHSIYWSLGKGVQASAQRYLGLPVISGMKITKIEFTNGASNKSANWRYVGVVDAIRTPTKTLSEGSFVTGGTLVDQSASGAGKTQYTFNVTNPLDGTGKTGKQLYLFCYKNASIFRDMTVTYEKVK